TCDWEIPLDNPINIQDIHTHSESSRGYHNLDSRLLAAEVCVHPILVILRYMRRIYPDCLVNELRRVALLNKRLLKVLRHCHDMFSTVNEDNCFQDILRG